MSSPVPPARPATDMTTSTDLNSDLRRIAIVVTAHGRGQQGSAGCISIWHVQRGPVLLLARSTHESA